MGWPWPLGGGEDVLVNEALRPELLERAGRDQAARESLRPGRDMQQWTETVEPVDRANTAQLREIMGEHGWPGHQLVGEATAHPAWLLAQHATPGFQEEAARAAAEGIQARQALQRRQTAAEADDAGRRQASHWHAIAGQQRELDHQFGRSEEEAEADREPEAGR